MVGRLHPEVEQAMDHVVREALAGPRPTASSHYHRLASLVTARGRQVPSYSTFQRRFAAARASVAREPRLVYAVHHERLDLRVQDREGHCCRPLVTLAVCLDVAGDRPVAVCSRIEVTLPERRRSGRPDREAWRRKVRLAQSLDQPAPGREALPSHDGDDLRTLLASINTRRARRGEPPIPLAVLLRFISAAEHARLPGSG